MSLGGQQPEVNGISAIEQGDLDGYSELLEELRGRIQTARVKAALAVNAELARLYWGIGKDIIRKQEEQGWGAKVMARLCGDLRKAFPGMKGFSVRNLKYMRGLAKAWPGAAIGQQLAAQLPWGHNILVIQKVKDPSEREWYIRPCVENGWSRNVLGMQIETGLYGRRKAGQSIFEHTHPAAQSDLAQGLLKDPYNFEFLGIAEGVRERELEQGLHLNIRNFLIELGQGVAFMGSQVQLTVGGEDFYLDLLFYHVKLRSHVVIELKTVIFKPEYAGKLNFYLSTVGELMRHADDRPSIGPILCRGKNRAVAEFCSRDLAKPSGISEYQLGGPLPGTLTNMLPSVDELEAELCRDRSSAE